MKFIEKIIECSHVKEAKLYGPAKKASQSPETGIIIQNPVAFHVIRDSATIASKYLPLFVFGHYANPFDALSGKFTRRDIEEFIASTNSDIHNFQLLTLILEKIKKTMPKQTSAPNMVTSPSSADDPYGDYESYSVDQPPSLIDNLTQLCIAFNVIE